MNEHQLRCFVLSAEYLNFTKAAASLYMTQAAMTYQITELEKSLDTRLFVRARGRISLTPSGEAFLLWAKRILSDMERARKSVSEATHGKRESIGIGIYGDLLRPLLPGLLSHFREQHPDVDVSLEQGNYSSLIEGLNNGKLDIAFLTDNGDYITSMGWLDSTLLFKEEFVVAVPSGHPFASRETLTMDDLLDEHVIIFSEQSIQERETGAYEFSRIHYSSDPASIPPLIEAGYGLSVYISHVAPWDNPAIAMVPLDYEAMGVYLCRKKGETKEVVTAFSREARRWIEGHVDLLAH